MLTLLIRFTFVFYLIFCKKFRHELNKMFKKILVLKEIISLDKKREIDETDGSKSFSLKQYQSEIRTSKTFDDLFFPLSPMNEKYF